MPIQSPVEFEYTYVFDFCRSIANRKTKVMYISQLVTGF
jgi:hypothetical protein